MDSARSWVLAIIAAVFFGLTFGSCEYVDNWEYPGAQLTEWTGTGVRWLVPFIIIFFLFVASVMNDQRRRR